MDLSFLTEDYSNHKAGFVSIVGKPNVGKSTLMNALLKTKLSIVTPKAQTTRHRILGFLNEPDYQIIFSDTPGIINPQYELHKRMMEFVEESLQGADLILLMIDVNEKYNETEVLKMLQKVKDKVLLVVNKVDLTDPEKVQERIEEVQKELEIIGSVAISALHNFNLDSLLKNILDRMPIHPPFYDKEQLSTHPERFFISEMIREKIFMRFKQEIPYSCEVGILEFKEEKKIIRIEAEIYVERNSQKAIIIGKDGRSIKSLGIDARKDIEKFLQKKVFLSLYVKVAEDWKNKAGRLKNFGYFS